MMVSIALNVSVAYAGPEWAGEIAITIAQGATLEDAITAADITKHITAHPIETLATGIWGKAKARDYVLREGDRIELYRPLKADPKDARRTKANKIPGVKRIR